MQKTLRIPKEGWRVYVGDALASLKTMPDQCIHACVTSPPYFGLRDYGVDGQMGLEQTPAEYVTNMVELFREVRRVLRDDGTLWLNIGDSYTRTGGTDRKVSATATVGSTKNTIQQMGDRKQRAPDGLPEKNLIGIPWRLAFGLQDDGWYLRQEIIWHKSNAMPESVKDRCVRSHEHIFLLSKKPRYYFDHEAMREPAVGGNTGAAASFKRKGSKRDQTIPGQQAGTHREDREDVSYDTGMRTKRDVWSVPTRAFKGAHFATFPPQLIEPCILAGCPEGGVVLDPFGGSGTTAGVAVAHGRLAVLCELNRDYVKLMGERIQNILVNPIATHRNPN